MGFAFAFLFPLGAILIRVASFRGLIWVHAAIQSLAYALALAGLGLGIYIAVYPDSQVCCLSRIDVRERLISADHRKRQWASHHWHCRR